MNYHLVSVMISLGSTPKYTRQLQAILLLTIFITLSHVYILVTVCARKYYLVFVLMPH